MWDLPGPGLEPVFPALAGGFLTTAPPGKPELWIFEKTIEKTKLTLKTNLCLILRVLPALLHFRNLENVEQYKEENKNHL